MVNVQIDKCLRTISPPVSIKRASLVRAATQTLQFAGQDADLTLVITDNNHLQELNRRFLGVDASTDVLAFPAGEFDPDSQALYLGDVIISYPQAYAQARARGETVEEELQFLTVHGVLHLLGYDHAEEKGMKAMWAAQEEILSRLRFAGNPS